MSLSTIAWIVVAAICLVLAAILALAGYLGYFGVLLAVGLAAGSNLLRRGPRSLDQ